MQSCELLERYAVTKQWTAMERMLAGLSNAGLRRMESVAREQVLPRLDNAPFWDMLLHMVAYKRAAFLSGAVAVEHLARNGTLDFGTESVERLYRHLEETHPASVAKICDMMLPKMQTERQVEDLWKAFHVDDAPTRLAMLLRIDSSLSYFLIFKTLKTADDGDAARRCCAAIIKRNNDRAFNAACILKMYFGLENLSGRFSLQIEPYELSHIDRDFATFQRALDGKRPQL